MRFKDLSKEDLQSITDSYNDKSVSQRDSQEELSDAFDVSTRTIRRWAKILGVGTDMPFQNQRILTYDIETSRSKADLWWTGKQYVGHHQISENPRIISIAWKWMDEDAVEYVTWDDDKDDKKLLVEFLKHYNKADMVIGQNNDRFDNRWVNARAAFHNLEVNTFVKSFDIMKQTKRLFRLPSYSMAFIAKFFGLTLKQSHEGIHMWDMIEKGTDLEKQEYLAKMVEYNIGDIITTEEIYYKLRRYMGHKVHFGVFNGQEKYTCPDSGSTDVELYKTTYTTAGTIQHIMKSNETDSLYKISNRDYMRYLEDKMNGII